MKKQLFAVFLFPIICFANFNYDLMVTKNPGPGEKTMICLHGSGGNYKIAETLRSIEQIKSTLISFNFPDHDIAFRSPEAVTFGTIDELLPALYVIKQSVIDDGLDAIDLYGFSAGGGAAVNLIGVLNTSEYDENLKQIGIGPEEKQQMLKAIQNGVLILDTPLKSIQEIIDFRGTTPHLEYVADKYKKNGFIPLDSLSKLSGLSLNILIHFQQPDEILFNRDDQLYIDRLKEVNKLGKTTVILGSDGGHMAPHTSLWKQYAK